MNSINKDIIISLIPILFTQEETDNMCKVGRKIIVTGEQIHGKLHAATWIRPRNNKKFIGEMERIPGYIYKRKFFEAASNRKAIKQASTLYNKLKTA